MKESVISESMEHQTSKSARKREAQRLLALGISLTRLNAAQLAQVPLTRELQRAIADYGLLKAREAKRRQAHFIGKLMRATDSEPIVSALEDLDRTSAAGRFAHTEVERWRARLLADDVGLTEYIRAYPDTDRVALRNLIRDARRQPEKPSRELFRFIRRDQQHH